MVQPGNHLKSNHALGKFNGAKAIPVVVICWHGGRVYQQTGLAGIDAATASLALLLLIGMLKIMYTILEKGSLFGGLDVEDLLDVGHFRALEMPFCLCMSASCACMKFTVKASLCWVSACLRYLNIRC